LILDLRPVGRGEFDPPEGIKGLDIEYVMKKKEKESPM
jgi:hypothetical protein